MSGVKGNAIVGQSGGPTCVINSSLAGVYAAAKKAGCEKVYGMRNGIQGLLDKRYVNLCELLPTDKEIELLKRTPSSYLGSCRFKLPNADEGKATYDAIFAILKELNIHYFFYIGGNDSMDTICKLHDYGEKIGSDIRFVGVPKTIDNDLDITDHTPGFGSAAKYVATSTREIALDSCVYGKPILTVIEVMGRNAGWLTGAAALANDSDFTAVDFIYLPELPLDLNACYESVAAKMKEKPSVVIAVSEGVEFVNGPAESDENVAVDAFGHKSLSGMGAKVGRFLGDKLGCKVRSVEYSSIQRCASHIASLTDIEEAFAVGMTAFNAAYEEKSGLMVIIKRVSDKPYQSSMELFDIHKIANVEKKVPREWINKDGNFVTKEFTDYCRPLIQGELVPVWENGIPKNIILK